MNYKDIDVEEFAKRMEQSDHVVLDVRSPQEIADGFVPGYTQINFFEADFEEQISKLDRTKSYLVYCRSGNRSGKACGLMARMDFGKLYNLKGGIVAWNATHAA